MKLLALMLCLLAPSIAFGALAEVGSGSQRAGIQTSSGADDDAALAYPGSVTTGNLLIVAGNAYDSGVAPASIGVTAGCGTFTVLSSAPAGVTRQFIAYAIASSSGACTATVNPAGSAAYISFAINEFSVPHATPLDVDDGATTGTGFTATASITTVAANALIISTMTNGTQTTVTLPNGPTEIAESDDNSCCTAYATGFRIVTTPGAYDMEWGTADSVAWRMHTASFKPAVAATGARRRVVTP